MPVDIGIAMQARIAQAAAIEHPDRGNFEPRGT